MDSNNNSHSNDFGASLPLPENDRVINNDKNSSADAAADLIRKKVAAAYLSEPDIVDEASDLNKTASSSPKSKHQQFIYELTGSGKSLEDIQVEWHDYYAGLPDLEKHKVWQEFYSIHSEASHFSPNVPSLSPDDQRKIQTKAVSKANPPAALEDIRTSAAANLRSIRGINPKEYLKSLLFGLGVGSIVLVIFLFSFFNERFIAPFIQPSRTVSGAPIIIGSGTTISNEPKIIIPKINVEIPVVYNLNTIDENTIQKGLEDGVVHYADTALPGQNGNIAIVGHSSNNIFNKGNYKFAFVLLSRLESGDTFYIQKDGKRYTYQIYKKTIVSPTDISVLGPAEKSATATLITCDPPGSSANRLVVVGEQISPDPIANTPGTSQNTVATSAKIVPGNAPSLWSRIIGIF
jgi:sortase A